MTVVHTVDRLEDLLQRLHSRSAASPLRREAQTLLEKLPPLDRVTAEQLLLQAGLPLEDLQAPCTAYLSVFEGAIGSLKQALPPGHMVYTLMQEHEQMLKLVDELEILNEVFQQEESLSSGELKLVECIAHHLMGAESHDRREALLFAELEQRGFVNALQIIQAEQAELRVRQQKLLEIASAGVQSDLATFKNRLNAIARSLVLSLRDHILKEHSVFYPTILRLLSEAEWQQMKQECDRIGYCSFTPNN